MFHLLTSVLLFGFVQPGCKLFLQSGLPLPFFCMSYVGIRFLMQIPLLLRHGSIRKALRHPWLLLALGLSGGSLQYLEFKGIEAGLPLATVTFLLFSYPVWILLIELAVAGKSFSKTDLIKASVSLSGIYFVAGPHLTQIKSIAVLAAPLAASILMATWISLSNKARKKGLSPIELSFAFDGLSFITLFTIATRAASAQDFSLASAWFANPLHWLAITVFAFAIGLLPNLLFYSGSAKAPALTAGLLLLIEPLISSAFGAWLWQEIPQPLFYLGAFLILLSNAPLEKIANRFLKLSTLFIRSPQMSKTLLLSTLALLFALGPLATAASSSHSMHSAVVSQDPPSTHGMLVFGEKHVYLSHLPMFHKPHDYQAIAQAQWSESTMSVYLKSKAEHPEESVYTLVPETFVLPEMMQNPRHFKAVLYRGHFERGGVPITSEITVTIAQTLVFEKLKPNAQRPQNTELILFGEPGEMFAAHKITSRPNFDQVVKVEILDPSATTGSVPLMVSASGAINLTLAEEKDTDPLKEGAVVQASTAWQKLTIEILDSLYEEHGDLAH